MERRYILNHNEPNSIYPVTKWYCEIKLRRKCKRSKYLIKKSNTLELYGDMIYPFEHNRTANELNKKRDFKESLNNARWSKVVAEYLCQTNWLMRCFKTTKGRYLRLLN